jgi:hypothetical protein
VHRPHLCGCHVHAKLAWMSWLPGAILLNLADQATGRCNPGLANPASARESRFSLSLTTPWS